MERIEFPCPTDHGGIHWIGPDPQEAGMLASGLDGEVWGDTIPTGDLQAQLDDWAAEHPAHHMECLIAGDPAEFKVDQFGDTRECPTCGAFEVSDDHGRWHRR